MCERPLHENGKWGFSKSIQNLAIQTIALLYQVHPINREPNIRPSLTIDDQPAKKKSKK